MNLNGVNISQAKEKQEICLSGIFGIDKNAVQKPDARKSNYKRRQCSAETLSVSVAGRNGLCGSPAATGAVKSSTADRVTLPRYGPRKVASASHNVIAFALIMN